MNKTERIKNLKNILNKNIEKLSRLIATTARKESDTNEIILLAKLLYDTRRNLEKKIHDYEKRLCH